MRNRLAVVFVWIYLLFLLLFLFLMAPTSVQTRHFPTNLLLTRFVNEFTCGFKRVQIY